MPKVSIVVPIYNNEKYLEQCLNSILNQSLQDIEVVCVNDGSTDNSLKVIQEYAQKDARVKVLTKPNAGYGHSMNVGIAAASGEYIGIVDSDDYILPNMYEVLYDYASKYDLDMIRGGYYKFYEIDGEERKTYWTSMALKYTDIVYCPRKTSDFYLSAVLTPSGIYKADFLSRNNIRYNESPGAGFQDHGFWFMTHVLADRVMFIRDAFYMYRFDNPNSSIYSIKSVDVMNKEYDYIKSFVDERKDLSYVTVPFYWKARFLNCKLTYARLVNKISPKTVKSLAQAFAEARKNDALDVSLYSGVQLKSLNELIDKRRSFCRTLKSDMAHELYQEHISRDLNGNKPSRIYQFVWYFKRFGMGLTLRLAIKKVYEFIKKAIRKVHNSANKHFYNLRVKFNNEYSETVKTRKKMDAYLNAQADKDYRDEMIFWWSQKQGDETLSETKKRFFRNMPPAEGSLRERQKEYVAVLEALKELLDKNNIVFWPMGGTMVGMLRHEGFVPWDDDIDISMMYEDKEKLYEIVNCSEELKIEEVYWCGNTVLRCPRVSFKNPSRSGLVDVFLWERANFEPKGYKPLWSKRNSYSEKMNQEYRAIKGKLTRLYKGQAIYDPHDRAILEAIFDKHRNACIKACGTGGTTIYGSIDMWFQAGKWNSVYSEEYVYPMREATFEGSEYKIPYAAEQFLTDQYGDWMSIPKKVKPSHGG